MGIEQAFDDRTLLDVVSLLSSRNESGRLKIAGGTMRGAFFFSKGKLVDAHMGPFSGFQAVNIAISVGKARLSFDPSIEAQLSSFKVPAERVILKERFGIETEAPKTSETEAPKTDIETDASETLEPDMTVIAEKPLVSSPPPLPPALPRAAVLLQQAKVETKKELESIIRQVREATIRRFFYAKTRLVPRGFRVDSLSRRGLVIFLILLIVIPTTASLAAYLRNSPETGVPDSPASTPTETSPAPVAVSAPAQPEENLTTPLPEIERVPLRPQRSLAAAETPIEKGETNPVNPAPAKDEGAERIEDSKVEVQQVESSARSSSRTVAIVVEIEAGRVTEAFVQRPQQGLAAYEATALRLARQRRFAKGRTGRETITLQVTREP